MLKLIVFEDTDQNIKVGTDLIDEAIDEGFNYLNVNKSDWGETPRIKCAKVYPKIKETLELGTNVILRTGNTEIINLVRLTIKDFCHSKGINKGVFKDTEIWFICNGDYQKIGIDCFGELESYPDGFLDDFNLDMLFGLMDRDFTYSDSERIEKSLIHV